MALDNRVVCDLVCECKEIVCWCARTSSDSKFFTVDVNEIFLGRDIRLRAMTKG